MEERVRNTTDRVEHITTKMEDLNQKANCQIQSMQVRTNSKFGIVVLKIFFKELLFLQSNIISALAHNYV